MTREAGAASAVAVVVADSPDGVQKYTASISCAADAEIAAVESGRLERFFEVIEGGEGARFVRARAVDMTGEARHAADPTTLFTVRFADPVPVAEISLSVESLIDHAGERIGMERVRFDALE
ncbi:hypothetical protein ACNS7O_12485 [Haloferacaceae archaeon DSL9]